jgi:hypothetical protein
MTRYTVLTNFQLFLLALITGLIAGGLVTAYTMYREVSGLPLVSITAAGQCVKVTNFENGHAFTCPDVDVVLRKYRKTITQ